jgi:hypothetical protein
LSPVVSIIDIDQTKLTSSITSTKMLSVTFLRQTAPTAAIRSSSAAGGVAVASRLAEQRRNYHENIVEHYENPRNVGSLDKNDENVGTVSDV